MSSRSLESLPPTETLDLENGLTLIPRIKLLLKVDPTNPSSSFSKPVDEWQLKRAIIEYLKTSFTIPIPVPEEDLHLKRYSKDLKKRKRDDPIAQGTLFIHDLGFITNGDKKYENLAEYVVYENGVEVLERKFLEWRGLIVDKMDGIELNLEGVKLKLSVFVSRSDDFEGMRKEWEEIYAFGGNKNRGYVIARGGKQHLDTIVLRGVLSRWFAEPRVLSKPSMLVTHVGLRFPSVPHFHSFDDNKGSMRYLTLNLLEFVSKLYLSRSFISHSSSKSKGAKAHCIERIKTNQRDLKIQNANAVRKLKDKTNHSKGKALKETNLKIKDVSRIKVHMKRHQMKLSPSFLFMF